MPSKHFGKEAKLVAHPSRETRAVVERVAYPTFLLFSSHPYWPSATQRTIFKAHLRRFIEYEQEWPFFRFTNMWFLSEDRVWFDIIGWKKIDDRKTLCPKSEIRVVSSSVKLFKSSWEVSLEGRPSVIRKWRFWAIEAKDCQHQTILVYQWLKELTYRSSGNTEHHYLNIIFLNNYWFSIFKIWYNKTEIVKV
jgi:hypothetical protein